MFNETNCGTWINRDHSGCPSSVECATATVVDWERCAALASETAGREGMVQDLSHVDAPYGPDLLLSSSGSYHTLTQTWQHACGCFAWVETAIVDMGQGDSHHEPCWHHMDAEERADLIEWARTQDPAVLAVRECYAARTGEGYWTCDVPGYCTDCAALADEANLIDLPF